MIAVKDTRRDLTIITIGTSYGLHLESTFLDAPASLGPCTSALSLDFSRRPSLPEQAIASSGLTKVGTISRLAPYLKPVHDRPDIMEGILV